MELDNLKRTWEAYDRKLEAILQLNRRALRDALLGKTAAALGRLSRWLWIELACLLVAILWLGSFVWEQSGEPRFLFPAATLHVGTVLLAVLCVRQMVGITAIDHGAPLVEIQRRLEALRVQRIRTSQWTLLLAPLAWTPLLIVLAKGLLAVDIYAVTSVSWLVSNVLFGVLVVATGVWIGRRYADRLKRSTLARRLLRELGGQNLTAARGFLRSLEQFEEEAR